MLGGGGGVDLEHGGRGGAAGRFRAFFEQKLGTRNIAISDTVPELTRYRRAVVVERADIQKRRVMMNVFRVHFSALLHHPRCCLPARPEPTKEMGVNNECFCA